MRTVRDRFAAPPVRHPKVSVCIPAYNTAGLIDATIRSVLDQELTDLELIVVDDDSSDGTVDVAAAHDDDRLRIFRNTGNAGPAANWNRAVGLARGRYVKVLCGDDLLLPGCLQSQATILDAEPGVALVAGRRNIVDATGRILIAGRGLGGLRGVVAGRDAVRATVRAGTNLFGEPACVLLRQALVSPCGDFSPRRRYTLDLDYWCRILRLGALFAQDDTIAAFRVSARSWSAALVREQAAQAIELFRDLHEQDPSDITRQDLALGAVRSRAMAVGRAAGYRALAASRRFGPAPGPARERCGAPPRNR